MSHASPNIPQLLRSSPPPRPALTSAPQVAPNRAGGEKTQVCGENARKEGLDRRDHRRGLYLDHHRRPQRHRVQRLQLDVQRLDLLGGHDLLLHRRRQAQEAAGRGKSDVEEYHLIDSPHGVFAHRRLGLDASVLRLKHDAFPEHHASDDRADGALHRPRGSHVVRHRPPLPPHLPQRIHAEEKEGPCQQQGCGVRHGRVDGKADDGYDGDTGYGHWDDAGRHDAGQHDGRVKVPEGGVSTVMEAIMMDVRGVYRHGPSFLSYLLSQQKKRDHAANRDGLRRCFYVI